MKKMPHAQTLVVILLCIASLMQIVLEIKLNPSTAVILPVQLMTDTHRLNTSTASAHSKRFNSVRPSTASAQDITMPDKDAGKAV